MAGIFTIVFLILLIAVLASCAPGVGHRARYG